MHTSQCSTKLCIHVLLYIHRNVQVLLLQEHQERAHLCQGATDPILLMSALIKNPFKKFLYPDTNPDQTKIKLSVPCALLVFPGIKKKTCARG